MQFMEITRDEFDIFARNHVLKNFYQSAPMYDHYLESGIESYLVALKDENKILCCALLSITGNKGGKTFEARKGYLIDYADKELLKEFNQKIKKFIKEKGAFRLFIEPYVPLIQRDINAEIVADGFDNRYLEQKILDLGFKSIDVGSQVKWVFALDINGKTKETLFSEFAANTRNYINRTINKYKIEIKTLSFDELSEFKQITADTCERREFGDKSLEYYQSMFKSFKDEVVFKIASLNCDKYISVLEEENVEFEKKISALSDSSSNRNKKTEMKKNLENNIVKIEEIKKLKKQKGNIIPLAGAMFILYGDEIIYLFSGSYKEYMNFYGQYALQWDIIGYAADNEYKRYNFYGIKDVFDKNGKDYGVYEFKKGFNGYVEELMPPYEIGVSNFYKIYNRLRQIKNIIRK